MQGNVELPNKKDDGFSHPQLSEVGILLNRFKLLAPLGEGGMATVHRAHDLTRDEIVAVKSLKDDGAGSNAKREARAARFGRWRREVHNIRAMQLNRHS